jgi:hypothetical protein
MLEFRSFQRVCRCSQNYRVDSASRCSPGMLSQAKNESRVSRVREWRRAWSGCGTHVA